MVGIKTPNTKKPKTYSVQHRGFRIGDPAWLLDIRVLAVSLEFPGLGEGLTGTRGTTLLPFSSSQGTKRSKLAGFRFNKG